MNQTSRKQSYVIQIAPVREGSTRPPAGWCEGETSPFKIFFIYQDFYDAGAIGKHFNVHDNLLTPFYSLQKVLVGVSMVVRGALWLSL